MDVLATAADAAGLLGCSSRHACVYLTQILQETCIRMEECTDGDAQLSVTLCRKDARDGMLLYATGCLDGDEAVEVSEQIENQIAAGVDSMVLALQDLAVERRATRGNAQPRAKMTNEQSDSRHMVGADMDAKSVAAYADAGEDMHVDDGAGDGGGNGPLPAVAIDDGARSSLQDAALAESGAAAGGDTTGRPNACSLRALPAPLALRGSTPGRPSPSPCPSPPPRGFSPSPHVVAGYFMDKSFRVPGLTVPPDRIPMACGRGPSRREPPAVSKEPVKIPDDVIEETIADLSGTDRGDYLRKRLVRFGALYKFVVDTLVDRDNQDGGNSKKADHRYPQLTPEAVRGLTVIMNWEGKEECIQSPMLGNSHDMKVPDTLAIIAVLKLRRDPFFLWLLGHFSRGAMAQPDAKPPAGASSRGSGHKRSRTASRSPAMYGNVATGASGAGPPAGAVSAAAAGTSADVGSAARSEGEGSSDGRRGNRAQSVVELMGARSVTQEGRIVGTVEVHPEWSSFHGAPTPLSVVPCFLREVADGCGAVVYPFGQDATLCLEKGDPAAEPVPLRDVGPAYKIAWPIELFGYVLFICSVFYKCCLYSLSLAVIVLLRKSVGMLTSRLLCLSLQTEMQVV